MAPIWLRELFRRRWERRLDAELAFHLDSLVQEYLRQGLNRPEAERRARLEFGGIEVIREEVRDQRRLLPLDTLLRDLRFAVRNLGRNPGFTLAATLTLALGLGATTGIFRLYQALALRPLPVSHPERLALVDLDDWTRWSARRTSAYPVLSNPLWEAFRDRQNLFGGALAWANTGLRIEQEGGFIPVRGLYVSGGFFDVLGLPPHLGRLFSPADDVRGCLPGVVLSHAFWQRQYGGDPTVVGRTVRLNGSQAQVLGVAPATFTGLEIGRSFDLAVPICAQQMLGREVGWLDDDGVWWLTVMARLPAGLDLASADARLGAVSTRLFEATVSPSLTGREREDYLSLRLTARDGARGVSWARTRYRDALLALLGTTAAVLLLASTNLANLILARGSGRHRELALRLALGASRGDLLRILMAENGLLAAAGSLLGLGLAEVGARLLIRWHGRGLVLELPFDPVVIGGALALAATTCVVFGIFPALRTSQLSPASALAGGGRSLSAGREAVKARRVLVAFQVAISVLLLFGALLFGRTLRQLLSVDPGFDPDGVTVATIEFSRAGMDAAAEPAFRRGLLERFRRVPGLDAAAEVRHVPLGGTGSSAGVGRPGSDPNSLIPVRLNGISDGYLAAMGIRLLAGSDFTAPVPATSPRVAIVNPTLVGRLGIQGDPVGQHFIMGGAGGTDEVEIVGVAEDTRYFSLREEPLPIAFLPITQVSDPRRQADLVMRSGLALPELQSLLTPVVAEASPGLVLELKRLDAAIDEGLTRERLMVLLSVFFGIVALMVASIGLYGIMSYLVARRTNEIGIRLALGATKGQVLGLVLRQAAWMVLPGLAAGVMLALAAGGWVQSLVYGIDGRDPMSAGIATLVLAATTLVAALVPAHRAASVELVRALRGD